MLKPCPETADSLPGKHLEPIDLPQGMQMLLPGLATRRVWQNIIAGYARVSSVGQSVDVQREKLANCDKLFEEKRSGTTDACPQLKECLNYVRDGDQLIVTRSDLRRATATASCAGVSVVCNRCAVWLWPLTPSRLRHFHTVCSVVPYRSARTQAGSSLA